MVSIRGGGKEKPEREEVVEPLEEPTPERHKERREEKVPEREPEKVLPLKRSRGWAWGASSWRRTGPAVGLPALRPRGVAIGHGALAVPGG